MKKYLILVKHFLPEIKAEHPSNEWKLSTEGRLRVHRLAAKLMRFGPEAILTSSEAKAKETAEILASLFHLEMQVAEDLHEHDRTNTPFLSPEAFQESISEFFARPDQLVFGRETADQAHARFESAMESALNDHMGKTITIVSHGTVLSLFISRRTGISSWLRWNELGLLSFIVLDPELNTIIARENHI
jgi:broad specificity phosphatase PhoE